MAELIHEHSAHFIGENGANYRALIFGEARPDGSWTGWIEFHPSEGSGPVRRTGAETTQADRAALAYWADGLEPVYLEGAFARAR